jgi:hypothetical protein
MNVVPVAVEHAPSSHGRSRLVKTGALFCSTLAVKLASIDLLDAKA